jgi:hypothetical protein
MGGKSGAAKSALANMFHPDRLSLIYYCNTPVLEVNAETNRTAPLPVNVFRFPE